MSAMVLHERLRYARERAKLTLQQVEEHLGIGLSSLSAYENGHREPSFSQLQALGELYHRPLSFFFGEEPLGSEIVLWWSRPPSPAAEEIETRFLELCHQFRNLEVWTGDATPSFLAIGTGVGKTTSVVEWLLEFREEAARQLAYQVRDSLHLGDRPGLALLPVLEDTAGVKVFYLPFEAEAIAACAVSDSFGCAVLLNTNHSRRQRTAGLAHELFHLLTWEVYRPSSDVASEQEEQLADCFAGHLLMPEESLRIAAERHIREGRITFAGIADLSRQFSVPVEMMLRRLGDLFQRPKDATAGELLRFRAGSTEETDEGNDLVPTRPARFRDLAVRAYYNGEMSLGRLAEYLGISRKEATTRYVQTNAGWAVREEVALIAGEERN